MVDGASLITRPQVAGLKPEKHVGTMVRPFRTGASMPLISTICVATKATILSGMSYQVAIQYDSELTNLKKIRFFIVAMFLNLCV